MAPLPKGGWHGEAVTGGFLSHRTSCNPSVGAGFYPARGRGRAPPLRTTKKPTVPLAKSPVIARPVCKLVVATRTPASPAPLPKGGWHGEAVTGGFLSRASCNPSVGATLAVARGRGRAPPLRTTRYAFVGADAYIGPNQVFPHPRQGTRALPYKVLRYRAWANRVVRPYKPFRRAGPMCPAAHQPPHPL